MVGYLEPERFLVALSSGSKTIIVSCKITIYLIKKLNLLNKFYFKLNFISLHK